MENKLIEITPTVFGVIVDEDAYDFEFIHNNTRIGYKVDYRLFKIDLPKGEFKIHGTCTLPNYDFDFETKKILLKLETGLYKMATKELFRTRIQKALNDLGLYAVNPVENPKFEDLYPMNHYSDKIMDERIRRYREAESKTVKKILIIEKINQ